jgi:hypothetical protein
MIEAQRKYDEEQMRLAMEVSLHDEQEKKDQLE